MLQNFRWPPMRAWREVQTAAGRAGLCERNPAHYASRAVIVAWVEIRLVLMQQRYLSSPCWLGDRADLRSWGERCIALGHGDCCRSPRCSEQLQRDGPDRAVQLACFKLRGPGAVDVRHLHEPCVARRAVDLATEQSVESRVEMHQLVASSKATVDA